MKVYTSVRKSVDFRLVPNGTSSITLSPLKTDQKLLMEIGHTYPGLHLGVDFSQKTRFSVDFRLLLTRTQKCFFNCVSK